MIIEIEVDEALGGPACVCPTSTIGKMLSEIAVVTVDEDGYTTVEYDYRDGEVNLLANGYPCETTIHRAWVRKECESEVYKTLDEIRNFIRSLSEYRVYIERVFETSDDPDFDKEIMDGAFD